MALRYPYQLQRINQPVLPLGGRWVRPRAIVPVALLGLTGSFSHEGLLDTGSDDTVFAEWVAARIGIDLASAPTGQAVGVGRTPLVVRYAELTLRLAQGNERREWQAWVGFTPARLGRPLLGFAGCLQFFTATFHGDREEVELAVNSLYPGT
jgi:hypothetical protein